MDSSNTNKIARIVFVLLISITMVFSAIAVASTAAHGVEFGGEGYANYLLTENTENRGGWSHNVIEESVGEKIAKNSAEETEKDFVNRWNNISNAISVAIFWIMIFAAVMRFVGRGVYEMSVRKEEKQTQDTKHSLLFTFIATGDERNKNGLSINWFIPMLKETLIAFLVVVGIWFLFSVLAGIVLFVLTSGVQGAAQNANMGNISEFGVSLE